MFYSLSIGTSKHLFLFLESRFRHEEFPSAITADDQKSSAWDGETELICCKNQVGNDERHGSESVAVSEKLPPARNETRMRLNLPAVGKQEENFHQNQA